MIPGDPFSLSSSIGGFSQEQNTNPNPKPNPPPAAKKKRNLPGTPGKALFFFSFFFSPIFLESPRIYCYFQMGLHLFLLQIQMPRSLLFLLRPSWPPTDSSAKFATKGFREIRICSFTEGVTTFHGSFDKGRTKRFERRFTSVQRRPAFTMTAPERSVTSLE